MTVVTVKDGLDIGLCLKGQRLFCRAHGIDFREFAKNGIPEEELAGIEDVHMNAMIARAKERERNE